MLPRLLLCAVLTVCLTACGGKSSKQEAKATATAKAAACTVPPDDLWVTDHKQPAADVPRSLAAFVGAWKAGSLKSGSVLELSVIEVTRDPQAPNPSLPYAVRGWTNAYANHKSMSQSGNERFVDERTLTFESSRSSGNLNFTMTFVIADDLESLAGAINDDGTITTFTLARCAVGK